ncbi:MAG: multifunctional 2-oxoglutarate metabolism enzyme, partial [Actinomycetota bacterium]|nr:multifunctional 2-oxoglutarate metabolism enzyme [Actinomycetota bacterium]
MPDETTTFGPNDWLVDEMREQYQRDPSSVSESWRDFFADDHDYASPAPEAEPSRDDSVPTAGAAPQPKAEEQPKAAPKTPEGTPIRGAQARIVANMEASLHVPTATSARVVPAKLLEVNRKILNNHLMRSRGGKVSFTHLIGYAVVEALKTVPVLNSTFVAPDNGGPPAVVHHDHVGLGLAVDVEKKDGTRTLLVPCIKNADTLDFHDFWIAYEDLIKKVRTNKIGVDDFGGTTVTLTNPGTIGTVFSVPRLMPGQGAIIGAGAIDYPAEYQAADPRTLAQLGVSKVVSLTSTASPSPMCSLATTEGG